MFINDLVEQLIQQFVLYAPYVKVLYSVDRSKIIQCNFAVRIQRAIY